MSEEHDNPNWGEKREGDGPNLRYDDFVGRIVQDPNAPPGVTLLSGYLGSSSEEGHVRLYLDEELSRYVEIPEKAIRHTQELPPEQSPLGGSLVWIDREAEVLHGAAGSERRKATFLEGQIAQDYIGGAGGIGGIEVQPTQSPACGPILPTDMGPGCGQSQCGPCIPPTEQVYCRTLTGIFCTRFGPGCRRTVFEPACTAFGPNCRTVHVNQCPSLYIPCFTQNKFDCVESGFVGCNPPIDFTIWQEQFGQQQFARQAAFPPPPPTRWGPSCQSRMFACPPTVFNPPCQLQTANCPTFDPACQTRLGPGCLVSRVVICSDTRTGPGCQVGTLDCPTRDIRCRVSQIAFCGETRVCEVASVACGVDPAGGGGAQAFAADPAGGGWAQPMETGHFCIFTKVCTLLTSTCVPRRCYGPVDPVGPLYEARAGIQPSQHIRCPSAVDACPTRINCPSQYTRCPSVLVRCPSQVDACPTQNICPSQYTPCQSQLIRCPSALDACPTRFNCPSVTSPCVTQDVACETFGPCPSAVDACPTRFGCFETQVCVSQVCQVSQACFPQGGGGGGGFGGGF